MMPGAEMKKRVDVVTDGRSVRCGDGAMRLESEDHFPRVLKVIENSKLTCLKPGNR